MASLGAQVTKPGEQRRRRSGVSEQGNHLEEESVIFAFRGGSGGVGYASRWCLAAGCIAVTLFLWFNKQAFTSVDIVIRVLETMVSGKICFSRKSPLIC